MKVMFFISVVLLVSCQNEDEKFKKELQRVTDSLNTAHEIEKIQAGVLRKKEDDNIRQNENQSRISELVSHLNNSFQEYRGSLEMSHPIVTKDHIVLQYLDKENIARDFALYFNKIYNIGIEKGSNLNNQEFITIELTRTVTHDQTPNQEYRYFIKFWKRDNEYGNFLNVAQDLVELINLTPLDKIDQDLSRPLRLNGEAELSKYSISRSSNSRQDVSPNVIDQSNNLRNSIVASEAVYNTTKLAYMKSYNDYLNGIDGGERKFHRMRASITDGYTKIIAEIDDELGSRYSNELKNNPDLMSRYKTLKNNWSELFRYAMEH